MIEARLADGRILQFPDGTDPTVIQSTVKSLISGGVGSDIRDPLDTSPQVFSSGTTLAQDRPRGKARFIAQDTSLVDDLGSIGRGALGAADVAVSLGTGALLEPLAGLSGIGRAIAAGDIREGGKAVEEFRRQPSLFGTFGNTLSSLQTPSTKEGRAIAAAIAKPFIALDDTITDLSFSAAGENPELATLYKTAIVGGLSTIGFKRGKPFVGLRRKGDVPADVSRKAAKLAKKKIDDAADALDVDIANPALKEQVVASAGKRFDDSFKGAELTDLSQTLRAARKREAAVRNAAYEEARNMPAGVRAETVREFGLKMQEKLAKDGFDVTELPNTNNVVSKINALTKSDDSARILQNVELVDALKDAFGPKSVDVDIGGDLVKLAKLETIRKSINRKIDTVGARTEDGVAMMRIRDGLDKAVDNQFFQNAIEVGSGVNVNDAINAWKKARGLAKRHQERFSDVDEIARMMKADATPAQVRNYIYGANALGAKSSNLKVIKKLKEILGEDSPEFTAIRSEFLFDLAEPLIGDATGGPNFRQFINRWEAFKKGANKPVLDELMPFATEPMDKLVEFAKVGVKQFGPTTETGAISAFTQHGLTDPFRAMAVLMFGHQLSKAALKVSYATAGLGAIFNPVGLAVRAGAKTTSKLQARSVYREILGYNPDIPMLPHGARRAAFLSELMSQPEEEQ